MPLPADLQPTTDDTFAMQRARDWAALRVKEEIGDRFFDSSCQYRAVRALREGRRAYLVFSSSYADQCFGCIANDHGLEAAQAWSRHEGDPEIMASYGPFGTGDGGSPFERRCVVIEPQETPVPELARAL